MLNNEHPVSFCSRITAHALAMPFSHVEQRAKRLQEAGLLPVSSGHRIQKVRADRLLSLLAACAHAERLVEAAPVADAFYNMPLTEGVALPNWLREMEDAPDEITLGWWFWCVFVAMHRMSISLELVRYIVPGQQDTFAAIVTINQHATLEFGEIPRNPVRAIREEITEEGFKELRRMFRHGDAKAELHTVSTAKVLAQ